MFLFRERPVSIMVLYVIILHFLWAVVLLLDDSALGATAISSLYRWIPNKNILALTLIYAAILAIIGIYTKHKWIVLFLIPQQLLLCISAYGAMDAVFLAQYADGIFRPRAFIFVDQIYSLIAALAHTAAIVAHAVRVYK